MLDAQQLTRRFATKTAVNRVSFTIRPGEVLGYLGPNGSGKSTTINMIVGLLDPTTGNVSLNGRSLAEDPDGYKAHVGYVPEEPHLYTHLTAQEYLSLVGGLRQIEAAMLDRRIARLLQLFDLWESRYQAMAGFSKGMRQRVLLCAALLHDPQLLVLDEPFSGLDVNAAALFRTLLRLFVEQGRMVLFSSHRFDVVQQLCSRVIILREGSVVAEGRVRDLCGSVASGSLEEVFAIATGREDFTPIAASILETVRT